MFRAIVSLPSSMGRAGLLVSLSALLLLLTVDGLIPRPMEASALGRQVSAARASQSKAAKRMRRADHRLDALRRERKSAGSGDKRALRHIRHMERKRSAARERRRKVRARVEIASMDLARKVRVHPNPSGRQLADKPRARKQLKSLEAKAGKVARKTKKVERATARAKRKLKASRKRRGRYGELIAAKIRQRESAESLLSARISRMLDLAGQKVVRKTRSTPASSGLKRPVRGHISQRYGCSRVTRSRRGKSCAYFHDGVDIAGSRGSLVRASADGVVAYSGFSPWDKQRRAFIVIIVHRGGLVTKYGHMRPRWRVKAGEYVRRGQTIGYVGTTGHTTGPHVHWEVSRKGRTIDPLRYG